MLNFNESCLWSGQSALRGEFVSITGLQQITFTAGRTIVERMIRYQGRSTQASSSSQVSTSILDKYVPKWMGEDAVDVP